MLEIRPRRDNPAEIQQTAFNQPPVVQSMAALFSDENTHVSVLVLTAVKALGLSGVMSWAPRTIRLELQDELRLQHIDDYIFNRLMAGVTVLRTDRFYQDLPAFVELCNIFSGVFADSDVWDPADPFEMAWAVVETQVFDEDEPQNEFSEEIRAYMGMMLAESGFISAPKSLHMAILPFDRGGPQSQFNDDPEILSAMIGNDRSLHEDIDAMLRENMAEVKEQLAKLQG